MIAKDFSYVDSVEFHDSLNDKEKFNALMAAITDVESPKNSYILANIYAFGGVAVAQDLKKAYQYYQSMLAGLVNGNIDAQYKSPVVAACLFIIQNFTEIDDSDAAKYIFHSAFLLQDEALFQEYFRLPGMIENADSFSRALLGLANGEGETIAYPLCRYWHDATVEKTLEVLDSLQVAGVDLNPSSCHHTLVDVVIKYWMASGRTLDDTIFMIEKLVERGIPLDRFSTMRLIGEFPFGRDSFRALMLILNNAPFNISAENAKYVAQSYLCFHASADDLELIDQQGPAYTEYVLRRVAKHCHDMQVFEHILQQYSSEMVMQHCWADAAKLDPQSEKLKIIFEKILQNISSDSLETLFGLTYSDDEKLFDVLLQSVCATADLGLLDDLEQCCQLYASAKHKVQREKILLRLNNSNADFQALLQLPEVQDCDLLAELVTIKQLQSENKLNQAVDAAEKLMQKTLINPTEFEKKLKDIAFVLLQDMANDSPRAAEFVMRKFIANKQMDQATQWFRPLKLKNNPRVRRQIAAQCYEADQHEFAANNLGSVYSCFELAKKIEREKQDGWQQQVAKWYCKAIILAPKETDSANRAMFSLRVLKQELLKDVNAYVMLLEAAIELVDQKHADQKELQRFLIDFNCELLFTNKAVLSKEDAISWWDTFFSPEYCTQYAKAYLCLLADDRFNTRLRMLREGMKLTQVTLDFYQCFAAGTVSFPNIFPGMQERAAQILETSRHPGLDPGSAPRHPGLDPGPTSRHPGLGSGPTPRHPGLDPGSRK